MYLRILNYRFFDCIQIIFRVFSLYIICLGVDFLTVKSTCEPQSKEEKTSDTWNYLQKFEVSDLISTCGNKLESRFKKNSSHVKCGLQNLGSTCYLNAATYLISMTRLKKLLLRPTHSHIGNLAHSKDSRETVRKSLRRLLFYMTKEEGDNKCIKSLIKYLKALEDTIGYRFDPGLKSQHDPEEFLTILLELLGLGSSKFSMVKREIIDKNQSRVSKEFPFTFLTLPLASGTSIQELINGHFYPEEITEEITKTVGVTRAPETLLIQLMRLNSHLGVTKDRKFIKCNYKVTLREYLANHEGLDQRNSTIVKYKLKGIIVHSGFYSNFGHYITYELNSTGDGIKLTKLDDAHIEDLPISDFHRLVGKDAYILAYERQYN